MTTILEAPCISCGRAVRWDRVGSQLRLLEGRRRHDCPSECGAFMPIAKERCARQSGHKSSHRRRVVMDEDARARRGKWAA